jgi:hypothetical protein
MKKRVGRPNVPKNRFYSPGISLRLAPNERKAIAQLTKDQPEQASAFLTILGDIRAELSLECAESDCKMTDIPKINNLSAEAVIYAIKARRTRRQTGSGFYRSLPKD